MTQDSPEPDPAEPTKPDAHPRPDEPVKKGYAHGSADRLPRTREGRVITGVCAGLGRYTGIDPLLFRVGFALLVVANGVGILLYVAAALLMPDEPAAPSPAGTSPMNPSVIEQALRRRFDGDTVLLLLGGLLSLGVLLNITGSPADHGPLTVITVFSLVLLVAHSRNADFAELVRTLPERLQGHPLEPQSPPPAARPMSLEKNTGLPEGMIDLATLGRVPGAGHAAPASQAVPTPPAWSAPRPQPEPRIAGATGSSCRPSAVLTSVTLLLGMMAAAVMIPVAGGHPTNNSVQILTATGLAVIGFGLLIGSVFGRGRGLVACGTLLSLGLMTTSVIAEAPVNGQFGDVEWRPVDATRAEQSYKVALGSGRLDLTALPLTPGQRIKVNAEITVGELRVTVPRTARIDLHVRAGLGDATVEHQVTSGPNAKVSRTFEPESRPKNPPIIELHVRGKVGNVEVNLA
ncbi:PspC domain-containing protein [Actinomadura sp. HBU206391]|uniref:PspC domain-containing protein n=1 Tax=Actinomadura sp. HBU206391 TaxID=2731692 RepID=UPI0016502345|nr:PspC domain-containing protein [Actinomadura sp. HBU206391]MBC6456947.1 PspC domain-containing protein [Actinomadura sp. HBU206391]